MFIVKFMLSIFIYLAGTEVVEYLGGEYEYFIAWVLSAFCMLIYSLIDLIEDRK